MKRVEVELFEIQELGERARKRARDRFREDQDLSHVWDHVVEDALQVGLQVTVLSDRERTGHFIESAAETAELIIENHGPDCGTYKRALEWRDTKMSDVYFLGSLLDEYYRMGLRDEENAQSDEEVDLSLEGYFFLEDGTHFRGEVLEVGDMVCAHCGKSGSLRELK